jgi:photosystem II stability/assembly factor-like uncharacterized protein
MDGGAKWNPQTSGTSEGLAAVAFVNAKTGWAVGDGGTILRTMDGGASWSHETSGTSQHLSGVMFTDATSGWAVGYYGTILHTSDGGVTWAAQTGGTSEPLYSVNFADANNGWAVGESGLILQTSYGGANWIAQESGTSWHITTVTFADAKLGWAVGEHGTILNTSDGGASWTAQARGRTPSLTSVAFADSNTGWAVGAGGTILHTSDGGASWKAQDGGTGRHLYGVAFTDRNSAWAVGDHGTILHTSDGGVNWQRQKGTFRSLAEIVPDFSGTSPDLRGVAFADAKSGWAVGLDGTIIQTPDGGVTWLLQDSTTNRDLYGVTFRNANSGWAVGQESILHTKDGGGKWMAAEGKISWNLTGVTFTGATSGWVVGSPLAIGHTSDGGATWKAQALRTGLYLNGVTFVNANSGWAAGIAGTILHTSDGGANWEPQTSGTNQTLTGVAFPDVNSGWAVSNSGAILHTSNGGTNWRPQEILRYRRYPAPWFYLAAVCVIPLLVWSAKRPPPPPRSTIEEIISSDSPVTSLQDDKLGHRPLVERLSKFLRNPNTSPPLVISLQARWGMGKSSVMRMLESSLQEKRAAVTVWFNAWHHQKEDQLLAYLLQTVQKKGVPPWFSAVGLMFRLDLLRVRLWAEKDRRAVLLLAIAFVTLALARPDLGLFQPNGGWKNWLAGSSVAAASWVIVQALVAFKSNPEKLVGDSRGFIANTVKELAALPSLVGKSDVRQEFANNLKDVVEALSPQRLVIFLDDLDRCKPEQVVQILEAINFLSSVASCIIIVGADYEKVETLVAMQFEAIARQEEENRGAADAAARIVPLRVSYARNYLKKIVNLRLNLRLPTHQDYRGLLNNPRSHRPTRGKGFRRLRLVAVLATPALLTLGVVRLAPKFSSFQTPAATRTPPVAIGNAPPGALPTAPAPVANARNAGEPPKAAPAQPTTSPTLQSVDDGRAARNWLTFGFAGLIGLAALMYWLSRPQRPEEAQDAEGFAEALIAHEKDIYGRCESPRELRRFLNYLRLVGTASGLEQEGDLDTMRVQYGKKVDTDLVELAVGGKMEDAGSEGPDVRKYFEAQCDLLGLDTRTFAPKENRPPEPGHNVTSA